MHSATGHVAVLCHRQLAVLELVSADPGDRPSSSINVAIVLRKLCVVTSGTPSSSRTLRHCLPKLLGSRNRVHLNDGDLGAVGVGVFIECD